ncbi:polysaccharide deacetylase family protein [Vibrio metschnikovii]|nr:polysaccharide deacetylase family protein [Vibrio metschnikovii]EKO3649904.1 polysaccharide deacetylase family protein [Vibrio metschnikovii]
MREALLTITYDDGRINNFEVALPIHVEYDIPATFAIIAGRAISPKYWNRHMQPWQVCRAYNSGIEISSHGYYHKNKFIDLNDTQLTKELEDSKNILNGFCGNDEINSICIPFSSTNQRVITEASKYYKIIRIHGKQLNDVCSDSSVVYSYGLKNNTRFDDVKSWIDEAIENKKWLVLMLHGVVDHDSAEGKYDITKNLLSRILYYIKSRQDEIKCISFNEALKIKEKNKNITSLLDISEPGSYVLSEQDGYMITYHRNKFEANNRNKVVISFGGLPSRKTKTGFGTKFLLKMGYDHIFVAQEAGSQYQKLSLEQFNKVVSPYLIGKDVYTYGSSLGAYAALYYGGVINAKIIASAPKNSAHPSMRKKRFNNVDFLHNEYVDNPKSLYEPVVLYDPFRSEETKFIHNYVLKAYPKANLVEFPYAGHTVLNTMKESGVLSKFITSYIDQDIIEDVELKSEDCYIWNAEKGRVFYMYGEIDKAGYYFKRSLDIQINSEAVKGMLNIYHDKNKTDEIIKLANVYKEKFDGFNGLPSSLLNKIGLET